MIVCVLLSGVLLGFHVHPFRMTAQCGETVVKATQYGFPFALYRTRYADRGYSNDNTHVLNPLAIFANLIVAVLPMAVILERRARRSEAIGRPKRAVVFFTIAMAILVACALFALNWRSESWSASNSFGPNKSVSGEFVSAHGWPVPELRICSARWENGTLTISADGKTRQLQGGDLRVPERDRLPLGASRSWTNICYNVAAGLLILSAVLVYSEWFAARVLGWMKKGS